MDASPQRMNPKECDKGCARCDGTPPSTKQEDSRRAAKRNLPEEIRIAQGEVDRYEQRIAPLRNALKNSKRRLARLQKLHAKK